MKRRYFSKFFSNLETILAVRRFVTWLQRCGRSTIGLKLELGRIAYMNSQFNFSFSVLNNTSCQSPVIEKGLRRIGVFLFVTFLKWVKVFHTFFSLCLILPSVCTQCFFFLSWKKIMLLLRELKVHFLQKFSWILISTVAFPQMNCNFINFKRYQFHEIR